MKLKHVLLSCVLLFGAIAFGQQPVYRQLGKQDGLPSNTIYSSLQDRQGYLWFGTEKGLVKYDGHSFKIFTHPKMTGQAVSDLQLDKLGRVWCQNFIGQHFYAFNDSLFYPTKIKTAGFYIPIVIDKNNQIYITIDDSIFVYNKSLNLVDSVFVGREFASPFLFNNQFTYTADSFLMRYNKGNVQTINNYPQFNSQYSRLHTFNINQKIFCYPKPFSESIIYQVYPSKKRIQLTTDFGKASIQTVSVTNDSLIFINTTDGTYLFNRNLSVAIGNKPLFKGYSISGVLQDKNGAYWITTLGKGILYIPSLSAMQFSVFDELLLRSCTYKNGDVLVGGNSGVVYTLNTKQNKLQPYLTINAKQQISSLLFDSITDVLFAGNGRLNIFKHQKQIGYVDAAIKEIKKVDRGTFIYAASGLVGLICFDSSAFEKNWQPRLNLISTNKHYRVYRFISNTEGLRNITISYHQPTQTIYVGTSKGLLQISKNNDAFLPYNNKPVIATNLEWVNNELYVSTENLGVLKLSYNQLLTVNHLMPKVGKTVTRLKYQHKILYVLSENGAFAFNPVTAKFTSIIAGFGQSNIEEYKDIVFNQQQIYLVGGDLVMLLPLNPPSVQHRNEALAITHLYSNYVPFDSKKVVRLSPSQNNIRILFSVPWLNLNDKLNFAYKLNDADWENIDGGNRELNLLALSPNKYTIQIKAESTSGFESNIEKVSFEILPPIWERWWFYFLMIVFVGAIFYALYAYRIKQINRQNKLLADNFELEKNLQKSMLSSIKAQMNPHFIFNALNTIQSYIYLNDKQNASRFLAKFSSLTRKILEMSNADTISLDMELSSLQLYLELEKMRFEESFEFNIKVDENIQTAMIRLPSMILQPYVENAIKHGLLHKDDDRKLNIHFSLNQTNLIVSIDDNGIGRKRASHINATRNEQHQSFSTQANQTRLELLMQSKKNKLVVEYIDKVDNQKQTMGTTVILTIPVIENSLVN